MWYLKLPEMLKCCDYNQFLHLHFLIRNLILWLQQASASRRGRFSWRKWGISSLPERTRWARTKLQLFRAGLSLIFIIGVKMKKKKGFNGKKPMSFLFFLVLVICSLFIPRPQFDLTPGEHPKTLGVDWWLCSMALHQKTSAPLEKNMTFLPYPKSTELDSQKARPNNL